MATFIVWATICITHIRFRSALVTQTSSSSPLDILPYKALWYPYGTYFALAANIFLIFFQGYTAFLTPFSAKDFVVNYILLPVFALFVVVYKFWKGTRWVRLEEMDIWTGRREYGDSDGQREGVMVMEEGEQVVVVGKRRKWWRRVRSVVVG